MCRAAFRNPNGSRLTPIMHGSFSVCAPCQRHEFQPLCRPWRLGLLAAERVLCWLWLAQVMGLAQTWTSSLSQTSASAYCPDRILIQPKPGISLAVLAEFHAADRKSTRLNSSH